MKLGIMQPYFFPYIGYFQLIQAVDQFIIYDNIQYTKEGWINRNRFLQNGKDVLFSLPLKRDSNLLNVNEREIAADFKRNKLLNQLREAYKRAPYFEQTYSLIEEIILTKEMDLFIFLYNSIQKICAYLAINSNIIISSQINIDHSLKNKNKVIAFCKHIGAKIYINPIGGQNLYSKEEFSDLGLELKFLQTKPFQYIQFNDKFVPSLSIIDVMMFNSQAKIKEFLTTQFDLI